MRSPSAALRSSLYALTTDDGLLCFVTLSHPTAFSTKRFCSDSRARVAGGNTYEAGVLKWRLPPDAEDEEAITGLSIEAVTVKGRELVAAMRALQDDAGEAQLVFRRINDLTDVAATITLTLLSVRYDVGKVMLEVGLDSFLDEEYGDVFTPDVWPALFQGQ